MGGGCTGCADVPRVGHAHGVLQARGQDGRPLGRADRPRGPHAQGRARGDVVPPQPQDEARRVPPVPRRVDLPDPVGAPVAEIFLPPAPGDLMFAPPLPRTTRRAQFDAAAAGALAADDRAAAHARRRDPARARRDGRGAGRRARGRRAVARRARRAHDAGQPERGRRDDLLAADDRGRGRGEACARSARARRRCCAAAAQRADGVQYPRGGADPHAELTMDVQRLSVGAGEGEAAGARASGSYSFRRARAASGP